jgi:hypothetical protein
MDDHGILVKNGIGKTLQKTICEATNYQPKKNTQSYRSIESYKRMMKKLKINSSSEGGAFR